MFAQQEDAVPLFDPGTEVMAALCLMVDSKRPWSEAEIRQVHPSAPPLLFTLGDVLERQGFGYRPTKKAAGWAKLARRLPVVQRAMRLLMTGITAAEPAPGIECNFQCSAIT